MTITLRKTLITAAALLPLTLWAQEYDCSRYPDYPTSINPDPSLMKVVRKTSQQRPDHVNNAETRFFPPVVSQQGGSCGSASRICYMFSYELNSFRGTNGKDPNYYYPSHFVWLLTNGNSGKDDFVQFVGVPSAATYGGQTYSKLFGYQEEKDNDFGWMTGYDKWLSAMSNRMLKPSNFSENLGTEEGREALKNWLWNHNGDTDFHSGGVVGIGLAANGAQYKDIPKTTANDAAGASGKGYVSRWGVTPDHAMTIVGYDDRIEFDLNGNGVYGETDADERGAWIMANSWGSDWESQGFIYCPYAYSGGTFTSDGKFSGNWWSPEVYRVRKNYRPLRTIKIKMDYSRRSEIALSAGVASGKVATSAQYEVPFHHFQYAGDGNYGNTNPAPEVPMLGRWADGKLHTEPMEFGYDLTDLTDNLDPNDDLTYFFNVNTKSWAQGKGTIYSASIIDYSVDPKGQEIPFKIDQTTGTAIQSSGKTTTLRVTVPGRGYKSPQNVSIADGSLTWSAPLSNAHQLTAYRVYKGGEQIAELPTSATSYALPADATGAYAVSAMYADKESGRISATVPADATQKAAMNFVKCGFSIPGVFATKYPQATIEYFIKVNSLKDWNQSAGPGWGTFMLHGNANGTFTAGWDTSNRINATSALTRNIWKHVAIVVKGAQMWVYVNGVQKGTIISNKYSGLGGFGDLVFNGSSNDNNNQDAAYAEIRIWDVARTASEISADYHRKYADASLPQDLVAYYKGDLISVDGEMRLRDHTAYQRHATIIGTGAKEVTSGFPSLSYDTQTKVSLTNLGTATAGQPVTLHASGTTNLQKYVWTAEGAGVKDLVATAPTVVFNEAGEQTVKVVATNVSGTEVEATGTIQVKEAPAPDATFDMSQTSAATGERVSFVARNLMNGYRYHWTAEGTTGGNADSPNMTVSYNKSGTYHVSLTVTDPQGRTATTTQTIEVKMVAPEVDFDVTPAVVRKGEKVRLTDQSLYDPATWDWTLLSGQSAMTGTGKHILFEPTVPGIYDVTLRTSNAVGKAEATHTSALIVCNADSKNGLNFSPSETARVTPEKLPLANGQNNFSIDWWMRPAALDNMGNGLGESTSTFMICTTQDGRMRLYVGGKFAKSPEAYVIPNEWHHYAVTFYMGYVVFFRDGVVIGRGSTSATSLPTMTKFSLGTDEAPMNATIDEFRVWSRYFSEHNLAPLHSYIVAPLEGDALSQAQTAGLTLYYRFDQASGNVIDASSSNNTGIRTGFGPDGDAWTNSEGVFALSFDAGASDVTSTYLTNYKAPFENTGEMFNFLVPNRFMTLAGWNTENVNTTQIPTGAHTDVVQGNNLAITVGQNGFYTELTNHKLFQTIDLPAGAYVFTANYGDYSGEADGCYLVAAAGNTLPNTDDLATQSIAFAPMVSKSATVANNSLFFAVSEPTTVSLGILASMKGEQSITFQSFGLTAYTLTQIEPLDDPGYVEGIAPITIQPTDQPFGSLGQGKIYDLSGRRVTIPGKGIYIIGGRKVMVK